MTHGPRLTPAARQLTPAAQRFTPANSQSSYAHRQPFTTSAQTAPTTFRPEPIEVDAVRILSTEEKDQRRRDGLCFYCGGKHGRRTVTRRRPPPPNDQLVSTASLTRETTSPKRNHALSIGASSGQTRRSSSIRSSVDRFNATVYGNNATKSASYSGHLRKYRATHDEVVRLTRLRSRAFLRQPVFCQQALDPQGP